MNRILVTGASGFVGRQLCKKLSADGARITGTILSNEPPSLLFQSVNPARIDSIGPKTVWAEAFTEIDTIIHLAARVHVMYETSSNPLYDFRYVNTQGTANLARQAAAAGVKRLIFMSTIGVNGDNSGDKPYTEGDVPRPHNPYSISKYEAEQQLWQISSETGIEVVTIRAPLVYGPSNPSNFLSLLRIISKGIPLPLASINNRRSLIYVGNLIDALATCAVHPAAAGKTYLVSDGEDVSTPELIRRIASALGVPARLFPFPASIMKLAGRLTCKTATVNRLVGSLSVDSSKIRRELGWKPLFAMEEGLLETAAWFKKQ